MTMPRHTVDTITSDALDELYERLAKATRAADLLADSHRRAEKAEAAVARAKTLATQWAVLRAYGGAAYELRTALAYPAADGPPLVHCDTEQQVSDPTGVDESEQHAATVARVRAECDALDRAVLNATGTPLSLRDKGVHGATIRIRAALDQPQEPMS